jgi:carbonic anhydrase
MRQTEIRERLTRAAARWQAQGGETAALRRELAERGQRPWAIVVACSDSRVIPEQIFDAGPGELFVIRVAGNVLDRHQLGSIEYAAAHLHTRLILLLGHTGCGAVSAALSGGGEGYIAYITDEILSAIGEERDPLRACEANVRRGLARLRADFAAHPEIPTAELELCGAIYDLADGSLRWLED